MFGTARKPDGCQNDTCLIGAVPPVSRWQLRVAVEEDGFYETSEWDHCLIPGCLAEQ